MKPAAFLLALLGLCACDASREKTERTEEPKGEPKPEAQKPAPKAPTTRTLLVRLVDSDGKPTRGVVWWANDQKAKFGKCRGPVGDGTDIELKDIPNKPVVLVPLPPGFVVPSEGWPRHVIAAGVTYTQLVLDMGEKRALRLLNWDRKSYCHVRLAATTDLEPSQHSVDDDGMIRIEGIRKGVRYNLYVRDGFGRYSLSRDLSAEEPWPSIRLKKGNKITGRLVLPEGCERGIVAIMIDRAVMIDGPQWEGDRFEIHGVPPGVWTVVAYTTFRGKYLAATAQADPETPVVLDLTKAR